jgi:hypothetical protein
MASNCWVSALKVLLVLAALKLPLVDAAAAVVLVEAVGLEVEVLVLPLEDVPLLLLELVLDVELPNSDCSSCMSPLVEFELEEPEFSA